MIQVKKYLVDVYHEGKPWVFFIIYCLLASALFNLNNVGTYLKKLLIDAFGLYIFGGMGWALLNAWMKERHEYRMK